MPSRWAVDLAGLAVNADLGGITLAGGLRKFGDGDNVEYVGMLMARFGVYGLSVYGGYGTGVVNGERFAAFFAFGAINGPIGGPPAFFVTGIGGGFGINRDLIFPSELATFGEFPVHQGARSRAAARAPIRWRSWRGCATTSRWRAASSGSPPASASPASRSSTAWRWSRSRSATASRSRCSASRAWRCRGRSSRWSRSSWDSSRASRPRDGVLWIQAQLTDNSWLLHESVRLTGGFAFVTWFAGPNRGQFVLTIGGFHPQFHRDGYPHVPRLGFHWQVSDAIAVKGENYFALTSEAVMAGGDSRPRRTSARRGRT